MSRCGIPLLSPLQRYPEGLIIDRFGDKVRGIKLKGTETPIASCKKESSGKQKRDAGKPGIPFCGSVNFIGNVQKVKHHTISIDSIWMLK